MPRKKKLKAKHPGGRPRKITEAVAAKLEEFFRIDATVEEACNQAGIDKTTLYREMERNPEFRNRIARAQEYPFLIMKKVVVKAANAGDGKLALKWLQNRQRDLYHERVDQKISGSIDELIKAQEAKIADGVDSKS